MTEEAPATRLDALPRMLGDDLAMSDAFHATPSVRSWMGPCAVVPHPPPHACATWSAVGSGSSTGNRKPPQPAYDAPTRAPASRTLVVAGDRRRRAWPRRCWCSSGSTSQRRSGRNARSGPATSPPGSATTLSCRGTGWSGRDRPPRRQRRRRTSMQLHTLRPRLDVTDVVWVTPRTPQTESLLAGEVVHWADPSPPRDMAAVMRNAAPCRVLFERYTVPLVVSTGAALALSVLPQARMRNIESVYIESATRLAAPSLSGRTLAMMPGSHDLQPVHLPRHPPSGPTSPRPGISTSPGRSGSRDRSGRWSSASARRGLRLPASPGAARAPGPCDAEVLWQTGSDRCRPDSASTGRPPGPSAGDVGPDRRALTWWWPSKCWDRGSR